MTNIESPIKETQTHDVSFIIPTLNEERSLPNLLDSIKRLEQSSDIRILEIIVVDAKSTDSTQEVALAKGCIIIETQPGHVSISRNKGAAKASGNILAFVDADCELPRDWLLSIHQELQQESVTAVGSKMTENTQNTTWVERAWFELAHRQHTNTNASNVDWLATFNLAVKKTAFQKAGGFDESLMTCEDVEFGYRLSALGTLRRVDSLGVAHHGESKTIQEFYQREAWRARGSLGILAKHRNNPREIISFLMPIIITLGLTIFFTSFFYAALTSTTFKEIKFITLFGLAFGPLPIILLTLRRRVKITMFIPCGLLMCVYFYSRFQGTLRPFPRVER